MDKERKEKLINLIGQELHDQGVWYGAKATANDIVNGNMPIELIKDVYGGSIAEIYAAYKTKQVQAC